MLVWCSSLDQNCAGHLNRRDDTKRVPHLLNYKHQFLPRHPTGSAELKCLISEMSVMHTPGAIPGTGADPGSGVQWWAWSYAGCRLDSRLKLSYCFSLWSFKCSMTFVLGRHISSDAGPLVLSHPTSWDLLSPIKFESVNPRGAVGDPVIDRYVGKQGCNEAGDDFWGSRLIVTGCCRVGRSQLSSWQMPGRQSQDRSFPMGAHGMK